MISMSIISCINYKFCRCAWPALETLPTVSAVDFAMTVSPTAVMSGPHAVERDGAAAAARERETELAGQINSLALDEFLVLLRPRESSQPSRRRPQPQTIGRCRD